MARVMLSFSGEARNGPWTGLHVSADREVDVPEVRVGPYVFRDGGWEYEPTKDSENGPSVETAQSAA